MRYLKLFWEKNLEDGMARAIGVRHFIIHHLLELLADAKIIPVV